MALLWVEAGAAAPPPFASGEWPDPEHEGYRRLMAWRHDDQDGNLGYISHRPSHDGTSTQVRTLHVDEEVRRQGIASHLMNMLSDRYEHIDHGGRTPEGQQWWEAYKAKGGAAE